MPKTDFEHPRKEKRKKKKEKRKKKKKKKKENNQGKKKKKKTTREARQDLSEYPGRDQVSCEEVFRVYQGLGCMFWGWVQVLALRF